MNEAMHFDIDSDHFARQLNLARDRDAIADLARRCVDYLRIARDQPVSLPNAGRTLLAMLQPSCVPAEQSVIFGIFAKSRPEPANPPRLLGVLYILHPRLRGDTWFITLLLIEPAARGRGLGTGVHRAFKPWAAARGAIRFVVAVSDRNPRAWHFWRDQIDYQEVESICWKLSGVKRRHRELEHRFSDEQAVPAWEGRFVEVGR